MDTGGARICISVANLVLLVQVTSISPNVLLKLASISIVDVDLELVFVVYVASLLWGLSPISWLWYFGPVANIVGKPNCGTL